jgi:HAD superfamily hydrolase (TIGR01509 family)
MISTILFDFGGTLDSDGGHWLDRTWQMYTRIGFDKIDKNAIKDAFYWADERLPTLPNVNNLLYRDMMQQHLAWQFQKLGIKDASKETEAVAFFVREAEKALRRNLAILKTLSESGYKLGVVSNNYGNMETLCREFGYNEVLSAIIDSAVEGVSKPDSKIYLLALERLGAVPEKTLMVGDNFERDILPARSLGMKTAWLIGNWKRPPCPDPTKVDFILKTLTDLPDQLHKLEPVHA